MKEAALWQSLKAGIPEPHWSRVENVAGTGIPDVNGCLRGREIWLELKMFSGNQLRVRNSQLVWMRKRIEAGGSVALLARKADSLWVIDGPVLIALASDPSIARPADEKSVILKLPVNGPYSVFHKPFKWESIRSLLFGEDGPDGLSKP